MLHSSLCWSQPALCGMHALPALCPNWSFSSPAGLFHVAHRLCATCMCCLFGPPDWSVCHPVALFNLPTGAGPTCSVPPACGAVWPSRLVSLSSSSPLLFVYRCRPYLLCATCMCHLFGPPDWSVCHPVASSTCLQVQALLALCHLHVVSVWPSRLISLSSSNLFYLPTGAGPTCSVPPACGVCLALQTDQSVIQ